MNSRHACTRAIKALVDLPNENRAALIFAAKAAFAGLLALWVSMRLELPSPRTSMVTVFILMQPQSGMVLAKSFYRFCGTLAGLVAALVLVSLFGQESVLMLGALAIWVGICTAGAARNRNFRSYGFLLSGYTASFIAIPALSNPDGAFMAAFTRAAEISIGIAVAGLVSALLFPQHAGTKLKADIDANFRKLITYMSVALPGTTPPAENELHALQTVIDAVGFEAYRGFAVLEEPETRARNRRLSRLNAELMGLSTRCHALVQTLRRLNATDQQNVLNAVDPVLRHFLSVACGDRGRLGIREAALDLKDQIHVLVTNFDSIIAAAHDRFVPASEREMDDFETVAELLHRLAQELHAYCATLVSLSQVKDDRERWPHRFTARTSWLVASVSGARASVVLGLLSWFWVQTAWPSGGTMVLNAASIVALASSSGRPSRTAFHLGVGTLFGVVLAAGVFFGLYPRIDGFPALCVVLAPLLFVGAFFETRRSFATIGAGFCIFFSFLVGSDNLVQYDPSSFFNESLALLLSMVVPAIAYAILLPTEGRWLHQVLVRKLRAEVVTLCNARIPVARASFESGARDLLFQLHSTTQRPEWRNESLAWFVAVLEVGHACMDIRDCLRDFRKVNSHQKLVRQLELVLMTQSRLFNSHERFTRAEAIAAVHRAHHELRREMQRNGGTSDGFGMQIRRVRASLHLLQSAMLDSTFRLDADNAGPTRSPHCT